MAALSESNSSKTWPMCRLAMIDGASGAFIDTERSAPTTSSCGAAMFVSAATAIHTSRIGTASTRIRRATLDCSATE